MPALPKEQNQTVHESYRAVSFINIDVEIINIFLANQIQQSIKRIIDYDQVGFIPDLHS